MEHNLKNKKNTENFGKILKMLITNLEEPSKTSGNQKWKGAIDNLKKKPIKTNKVPAQKK